MFSSINRKVKKMVLRYQKSRPLVRISDTTLRDGLQTPGVRVDLAGRVAIAQKLEEAGIHSIDSGFPASSEAEKQAVKAIAKATKSAILVGHSRTKREDIEITAEALESVSPFRKAITLFIGVSPLHREHKHGMSKSQIIDTACDAIEYAGKYFEVISFGPEDASRAETDFLVEIYEKVIQAGALSIGYTDTVGILTPRQVATTLKTIQDRVRSSGDALLAVHFHNDLGLATANALEAVHCGANVVQGTVNGVGERAGNTAIEEVVLALTLHHAEYGKTCSVDPTKLSQLSEFVAKLTGFPVALNKAVVGRNLFRTETGVHQNGQLKHREMYLPFQPELIGAAPLELVLGANSGRSAVRYHLEAAGLEPNNEHVDVILKYLKTGQHAESDMPEIRGFLDRIKPYIASGELAASLTATNGNPGSNGAADSVKAPAGGSV